MIVPDRLDGEANAVLPRAREEQLAVPQHPVAEKRGRIVENDQVEKGARHLPPEPPGESPQQGPPVAPGRGLVHENRDVEVAVLPAATESSASEEISEAHFRQLGERSGEPIGRGIQVFGGHGQR